MKVGQYMKEYRQKVLHKTQEEAADMCGVSTRTIQNWEAGDKIPRAASISAFFYGDPVSEQEAQELRLEELNQKEAGTESDKNNLKSAMAIVDPFVSSFKEGEKIADEKYPPDVANYIKSVLKKGFSFFKKDSAPEISSPNTSMSEDEIIMNEQNRRPFSNIAIFGCTGSGKTLKIKNYIKDVNPFKAPNIITADPAGDIYQSTKDSLENAGYTVKVFDIGSANFDQMFGPVKDYLTEGSVVTSRVFNSSLWDIISYYYMKKGGDPFWEQTTEIIVMELLNEYKSIPECIKHICDHKYKYENLSYIPEKTMKTLQIIASMIFESLLSCNSEKTDLFDLVKALEKDTENYLENNIRYAYFLIGEAKDSAAIEMNTSCILEILDYIQSKVTAKVAGNVGRMAMPPVMLCIDEAANVLPEKSYNFLSICHGRNISYLMAFQDINQVKAKFGSRWEMVCSQFDIRIFLPGVYDLTTEEYIASACGKTTIVKSGPYGVTSVSEYNVINIPQIEGMEKGKEIVISSSSGAYICENKDITPV